MSSLDPDRVAFSVDEAAKSLGVCRETIYRLKAGKLKVVKLGARTLVRRAALEAMLDEAEAA